VLRYVFFRGALPLHTARHALLRKHFLELQPSVCAGTAFETLASHVDTCFGTVGSTNNYTAGMQQGQRGVGSCSLFETPAKYISIHCGTAIQWLKEALRPNDGHTCCLAGSSLFCFGVQAVGCALEQQDVASASAFGLITRHVHLVVALGSVCQLALLHAVAAQRKLQPHRMRLRVVCQLVTHLCSSAGGGSLD
jgi:hypothetical protein